MKKIFISLFVVAAMAVSTSAIAQDADKKECPKAKTEQCEKKEKPECCKKKEACCEKKEACCPSQKKSCGKK